MLGEGFQVRGQADWRWWEVIIVQGAGVALRTSVRETGFLFDTSLHFKLHLWVGTNRGKRVQKFLNIHLLVRREIAGHGEGFCLESRLQTVRLVKCSPLVAAAVKLILDHDWERCGLRLWFILLLVWRSTGAEAQLGSRRILGLAAGLIIGIPRT